MPNIEYLLPNIGRTMPPGDPGSGEYRGLGRAGVASTFLRVPDTWPYAQLPWSCPVGALLCPHNFEGAVARPSASLGRAACLCAHLLICSAAPTPGLGRSFVRPSLVSFLNFLFLMGCVVLGMFLFLIFLPFFLAPSVPPPSFSLCSLPFPWILSLLFSSPSPPPADLLEI